MRIIRAQDIASARPLIQAGCADRAGTC